MLGNQNQFEMNSSVSGNNNIVENEMNVDIDMIQNGQMGGNMMSTTTMGCPIREPMREKCVHRTIVHEVPHVCPIRTKIINHHVYKHTYRPEYSCCEENTVSNVQCGSCCNFR